MPAKVGGLRWSTGVIFTFLDGVLPRECGVIANAVTDSFRIIIHKPVQADRIGLDRKGEAFDRRI